MFRLLLLFRMADIVDVMVAPRDPVTPTEKDAKLAQASSERLAALGPRDLEFQIGGADGGTITLPAAAVKMLVALLSEMAAGNAVTLVPVHAELTTQQAADFLGVSRPFLIKRMTEGHVPHRKVGTHRRVRVRDLLAYKARMDEQRRAALDELAGQSQELGMGY